jgi:DNA-binding HxlR family transcriptional regulator
MRSIARILYALSDDNSILLLQTIADGRSDNTETLMEKTKLSPKQYYSRMAKLIEIGLIKRRNKKHFLTARGKIVYSILMILEEMLLSEWKLKVIDSLEMSNELSKKERDEAINSLIDINQLKNIFSKSFFYDAA